MRASRRLTDPLFGGYVPARWAVSTATLVEKRPKKRALSPEERRRYMDSTLLIILAALLPLVVHVAPSRHRPFALMSSIAILVMYGVIRRNPFVHWELWLGLALGMIALALAGAGRQSVAKPRPRRASRRIDVDPDRSQPTGEIY